MTARPALPALELGAYADSHTQADDLAMHTPCDPVNEAPKDAVIAEDKRWNSRALIVDDDVPIRELLIDYLARFNILASGVTDGTAMRQAMQAETFDVVVLDLMLPGEDGLTLCRWLRAESDIPILMLTARCEPTDRIIGLELGADDYMSKPFEPRELVARIQTILRRVRDDRTEQRANIRFDNWRLNSVLRQLVADGLPKPERDNLVAINGLDEIVVLKPAQLCDGVWQSAQERSRIKQLLARIPHFKVRIGVGDYFAGTGGLARSYQTARDTLRRGMSQAPRKQVYFFEDYRLPVLLGSLADSWQADQLRAPLQKLAKEDAKGTLQKTLRQYFLQDCDLHPCAEALFIHPNTLRYRLTRIEQITGLNFNKLDDKFLLYLGLNLDG